MKIIRETIVAGRTVLQRLYGSTRMKTEKGKRAPKTNPTTEAVHKVNLRNAVRNLTAILNHNFKEGDYHITLTYSGSEPTPEMAKKNLQNFMRRIAYFCKKNDIEWKWVAVTEYENHRIHHHVVCSGIDPDVIEERWKDGYVNFKMLDESGNYNKLAEYLVKETEKTFRLPDSVNKKRYTQSGSIVIPQAKREEVSERLLDKDPEAYKGYYIDQDSYNRYEHAILGIDCVEYIQVSLDTDPRIKRWNKGRRHKLEKRYREQWEEQIALAFDGGEYA